MGSHRKRTPAEWFHAAAHCYIEKHQGCAACGQQHCVFRTGWDHRTEYHCSACDFSVCHDRGRGQYFASEGDGRQVANALLGHRDLCEDQNLV
jgi:hypothetical protein